jgi:aminopeptidase I
MTSFKINQANPAFSNIRHRGPSTEPAVVVQREEAVSWVSPHDPKVSPEGYTDSFLKFMNTSPTTYHAVDSFAKKLEANGFVYLSEREQWDKKITESNRFYTSRNGSSLLAFVIGSQWKPGNGAAIIGSHIDALAGKVKPISNKTSVDGYEQIGIAPYAGAFNNTWWDRDLGIGGRLIVRDGDNKIVSKLVRIPYPVARIPTLAPHFGTPANGPFNKETQMTPIIGLIGDAGEPEPTPDEQKSPVVGKHSLRLLRALSEHSGVPVKDFLQFELELYDTHPGTVGGLDKEFVFCPRIDDKLCSYAAVNGLLEALDSADHNSSLSIVALYDDEEIGSLLRQGAQSNLLDGTIERLLALHGDSDDETKRLTFARSFFLSADVIHAVNPNFDDVYLEHHKPKLNVGVTISCDPNGHMTTDAVSTTFVEEIARRTGNTLQYFQIRNDSRSGGTIGPYISSKNGIKAIDVGIPQLSMHSIRATTGSKDVWLGVRFFKAFFEQWEEVDAMFQLGDL